MTILWTLSACMAWAVLSEPSPPVSSHKKQSTRQAPTDCFSVTFISFWWQGLLVLVAVVFAVVMTFIIFKIVDAVLGMRVEEKNEIIGLDLTQQSEAAYTVIESEEQIMKLVIAIIQPHKLEAVKRELEAVEVNLMTVTNVVGQGRQKGVTEIYRGAKEAGGLINKVRLDIAVNEAFVEPTIAAITKGAHTGSVGDGKIFVVELADCIRLSSGERGGVAIG